MRNLNIKVSKVVSYPHKNIPKIYTVFILSLPLRFFHCHNLRGLEKEYGKNKIEVTDSDPKALADDGRLTFTVAKR
ncbi:hypothetical protein [Succinivibrio dextrinosolvens]|uniref:hypothetical protein n=1 Tax=Succinivibrio dextrinosolvens TaxID=83771 RepID=UPI0004E11D33|nr:hypothetical protein [Succinivibrio dextrinosolvens]